MRDPALSRMLARVPLGALLVRARVASPAQVSAALECQRREQKRLGTLLVNLGFVEEDALMRVLSQQLRIPRVDLDLVDVLPDLDRWISLELAEAHCVFPVEVEPGGESLLLATSDPTDLSTLETLTAYCGTLIRPVLAGERAVLRAVRRYYRQQCSKEGLWPDLVATALAQPFSWDGAAEPSEPPRPAAKSRWPSASLPLRFTAR